MADKGPFLTSCIIFYLTIGAAIFHILEQPNWDSANDRYQLQKKRVLKKYNLTKEALDEILEIVAEAAGQGVAITDDNRREAWSWSNCVVLAANTITTIGYGNIAPKTRNGRVFCILYGLGGIPLCLVWISSLGSFFGERARRLSDILIRKDISVKKVQITCTVCFLLWGLIVHLIIPPFVLMSVEGWSYVEGLYFSFITLATIGYGDFVTGVNPSIQYPRLYRVCVELWIYMGLAWLSLFFSWNVHMVVKAHKVLKKRRHRHKLQREEKLQKEEQLRQEKKPVDIFSFLSETNEDDYNTVMKRLGETAKKTMPPENLNRSRSCSDILDIQPLAESPRQKRRLSISEMFLTVPQAPKRRYSDAKGASENKELVNKENTDLENEGIFFTVPVKCVPPKTGKPQSSSMESRFKITKVAETKSLIDKDEKR